MSNKTMVLIHGAWQGSWAFDAWRPLLAARGWQTFAVDLPGNGCDPNDTTQAADVSLDLYTDHVVGLLKKLDRPVVLLGHSGGGITASQVAEAAPEYVACLVYLAGMMLPSGMSFGQLIQTYLAEHPGMNLEGIVPHLRDAGDGLSTIVPQSAACDIFLQDCDRSIAMQAANKLRPQPEGGRKMAPTLTRERYGSVPRIYVEALHDKSVLPPLQQLMQTLSPGATRLSMACGHVPQLVQPQTLTELLCPLLEQSHQTPATTN